MMRFEISREMIYSAAMFAEFLVGSYGIELGFPAGDKRDGRTGAMLTLVPERIIADMTEAGVKPELIDKVSTMFFFNATLMRAVEMIARNGVYAIPQDAQVRADAGQLLRCFIEQYVRLAHGSNVPEETLIAAINDGEKAAQSVIKRSEEAIALMMAPTEGKPN